MIKTKILQILIILFLASLAVNTGRQLLKLNSAKAKFDKAAQKLENLEGENQKLQSELHFRESSEFVEKAARDQLGLVKEGETVVILPKNQDTKKESTTRQSNLRMWLQRLFGK